MPLNRTVVIILSALAASLAWAADDVPSHPLSNLPLRNIGPALSSGRVADFAFHPTQRNIHYVAMASGGLWKTVNNGITWKPVFDNESSYALGVVELDPANPETIWVGTGENNSQRSVGFGDGVYKSLDGGASWTNMGLADSGHISMIRFHPQDRDTVYVAAQGPLWNSGGDRGLYRSLDGGRSWDRILDIDANTGVNEFLIHPTNPDSIVASSYQRRRHVWTLINGGPGGGVHKTSDGGLTWRKLGGGLPGGDLGRIGLAAAPSVPNVIYAIVEADAKNRGVYRSTDFGESWEKRSGHMTSSPQYYNELFVDPQNQDRVYSVDTFTHRSEDGGKTWQRLPIKYRHVDDHAMWIDPDNSRHFFIGGDGGMYETWDDGANWRHVANLPTTQFYRSTPDNDSPFYNVCAGTQDNHTQCGPSRTTYTDGISNADWWISQFGDGFKTRFDPDNPAIIYSQSQYGGLGRYDRITGERVSIAPLPASGQPSYKWNWNSPLIVSPHDSQRLYYGAERLLRSDDRGDSWTEVSEDLSRQVDRNQLQIMDRVWSVDAIAKNSATSKYGSIVALDESPLVEGLLYVGTDDGLIRVSGDGGANWNRIESFPGVPDMSLVEDIVASSHDADTAYATVDNHKRGDHRPYVIKTENRGRNWSLISGNLPERGSAHTIVEDHVDPDLLFVGTEFGAWFSQDGGANWNGLAALPTIAVRDLEIQRRENDLVIGTFGRGIWILDDYSSLRTAAENLAAAPSLFRPRDAWLFVPDPRRGWGGLGDYGSARYAAKNPPHGAVIDYYLPAGLQTSRQDRRKAEQARAAEGGDNPYPSWDELRAEDREEQPSVILTITDSEGKVVRRIDGPVSKGFHRVAWDMRYPAPDPVDLQPANRDAPWQSPPQGPLAIPGNYTISLATRVNGELIDSGQSHSFALRPLSTAGLVAENPEAVLDFQTRTAELVKAVSGAGAAAGEIQSRIDHLQKAVTDTPAASETQAQAVRALNRRLHDFQVLLNGDSSLSRRGEIIPMSINSRVNNLVRGHWNSRAAVPAGYRTSLEIADSEFRIALQRLESIERDLTELEFALQAEGAPWTPGRIPDWE
jgi:photosystem II stability/assembly factor-like uncharacterized protein